MDRANKTQKSKGRKTVKFEDRPWRLGVGVMLLNGAGQVFVARRIDTETDAWQMPQGGIDADEDPRAAALRELEEETGTDKATIIAQSSDWIAYDLPVDLADKVWKGRFRGQKQMWYALRFHGDDADIDLNHTDHPEFSAWKWADVDDLADLIVPFKRVLYERVVAEFRDLAKGLTSATS